jgi:hypothetical protein
LIRIDRVLSIYHASFSATTLVVQQLSLLRTSVFHPPPPASSLTSPVVHHPVPGRHTLEVYLSALQLEPYFDSRAMAQCNAVLDAELLNKVRL